MVVGSIAFAFLTQPDNFIPLIYKVLNLCINVLNMGIAFSNENGLSRFLKRPSLIKIHVLNFVVDILNSGITTLNQCNLWVLVSAVLLYEHGPGVFLWKPTFTFVSISIILAYPFRSLITLLGEVISHEEATLIVYYPDTDTHRHFGIRVNHVTQRVQVFSTRGYGPIHVFDKADVQCISATVYY